MKIFLLALVVEFFADWLPENTPVERYPYKSEVAEVFDIQPWEEKNKDHIWVFWNLGNKVKNFDFASANKKKLVLFTWEPPTVQPELHDPMVHSYFGKIYTWNDDLVDNKRYFKFFYPVLKERIANIPPFHEKKLCALIASYLRSKYPNELYSERENMIRFFENKKGEFDLYGKNWKKRKYKNWKGEIPDKLSVLKNYRFSICYENTKEIKGYITEKIFDCFAAGVVPIYWGASNVTDFIPPDCFIDRRKFKNNEEVYKYIKNMNETEYNRYLKAAENFLQSNKAKVFSQEHFIETLLTIQNLSS